MTLIDLGELAEPTDLELPRRRRPPSTRRWGAGVVALVVLLTLAGAAPPAVRVHATLPGNSASDLILTEGHIFVVTPVPGVTDGTQELVAYPRPVRATVTPQRLVPLWRVPVPTGRRIIRAESVDDLGVLVSTARTRVVGPTNTAETVLLDVRTGQQRWRAPGIATVDASGRVLLRTFAVEEPTTLAAVELATGRELWSTSVPAAWMEYAERDGVIDAVVVSTTAGDIEVLDAATGARRHRLPALDDLAGYQSGSVVGDLLLVIRNSRRITAYDLDGLVQRWQATMPLTDYVTGCGDLLCARSSSGGGAHLLDPDTGAAGWSSTDEVDIVLVATGHALAVIGTGSGLDVVAVDAATGKKLTDYGTWALVNSYAYRPQLLGVRVVPEVGLVLARFDPAEPQPRRVDVLAGAVDGCQYGYGLIACRREDGSLGVWQLRDGEGRA
ncbi:outer membrane protein assembly factor BamB family protein [Micromonospora craterilacus]|uniref:outer membrane protein assembly factor BamB family protein n=1 Tax=Micromonospora craterilacus TaxID=1655439 RepID=UPI001314A984|nr:PQQ-binding-like beta-propeller repeat protein [Micromonospora craterilacus]